jgi:hypothetical protein
MARPQYMIAEHHPIFILHPINSKLLLAPVQLSGCFQLIHGVQRFSVTGLSQEYHCVSDLGQSNHPKYGFALLSCLCDIKTLPIGYPSAIENKKMSKTSRKHQQPDGL